VSLNVLDLFCGEGGATRGYQDAGFEVTGVDVAPVRRYCGERFFQSDALTFLKSADLTKYDLIHASPPCQRYSKLKNFSVEDDRYPDLIPELRSLLESSGRPYVIENVPQAPLRPDLVLCGTHFGLYHTTHSKIFELRRHRVFEANCKLPWQPICNHHYPSAPAYGHSPGRIWLQIYGKGIWFADDTRAVLRVPWMTREGAREAIPPVFTEYIGSFIASYL
jgi:DNA (cytosine-5)-methyltransferase 1